jgi:hypothetical protein
MIAALILVTSPAFDLQLTHGPMSDIPAMALWTVVLVLLPRLSRNSALLDTAATTSGRTSLTIRGALSPARVRLLSRVWRRRCCYGEVRRANMVTRVRDRSFTYTAFAIAVYLCYAYVPLDTWWTLRFLFPAFPVVFVFVSVVPLSVPARLPPGARWLTVVVLVGTGVAHAVAFGRANSSLDSAKEWRYATAGHYIAETLPERAVFFTTLHSGSARYYSGRLTVRYDLIPPQLFERAIAHFSNKTSFHTCFWTKAREVTSWTRSRAQPRWLRWIGSLSRRWMAS